MKIAAAWLLAVTSVLASPSAAAQEPAASLAGVVESASQPAEPLRHAVVSLSGPDLPVHISVVADDLGRFRFSDLRPGRYIVTASKPAFVTSAYGARQPGGLGTALSIATGQHVDDLRVTLSRAAVLAGHVRDAAGAPAANIPIVVAPASKASGPGEYVPRSDTWMTDERGAFRAHGLAPGEYIVVAALEESAGRGSIDRPTVADIDASMFALQQRVAGQPPQAGLPDASSTAPHTGYGWAPIFYPGTTNAVEARRVRVTAGEVRDDIDFTIDPVPILTVSGVVVTPEGSLAQVSTAISRIGPPLPVFQYSSVIVLPRRTSNGDFRFPGLAPGRYVVRAGGEGGAWAVANVLVSDTDIKDLELVLQPPMSLTGRVVFESTSERPPADLAAIRVGLERLDLPDATPGPAAPGVVPAAAGGMAAPAPVATTADGAFVIDGILPGTFSLAAAWPDSAADGARWWLKSAMADGRDLLDIPLRFGTDFHSVADVVLTLSNRSAELTGSLRTKAGQPAPDYSIVVFSADRAHWFPGSRRARAVRPASDGVFTVSGLPAGDYLVAALTDAEPGVWDHASFLEHLAPVAVKVTISDGSRVRQDLQMAQ